MVADRILERSGGRIAHVVLSLACGGLERLVTDLAGWHQRHGLESRIVCLDERGILADEAERAGVKTVVVKRSRGWDSGLPLRLARLFREEQVTAVHTHGLDPMFYGGLAATLAHVPVRVHSQHNTMLRGYGRADRLKFRLAHKLFTHVVGVSGETTALFAQYGVPEGKRVTVLNGIDCTRFDEILSARTEGVLGTCSCNGFSIGTIARLAPEKGLGLLLEVFASIRASRPGTRLTIVGDGPERERLEKKAASLGLADSVAFPGRTDRVASWLAGFDLFVLPSLTEGIPLSLLEAMAGGVPVVASRVGGVPEVLANPDLGRLVAPGSADGLRTAVLELMDGATVRQALSRAGAKRVRDCFSLQSMAGQYRSLYTSDPPRTFPRRVARAVFQRSLPRRLGFWRGPASRALVAVTFDDGPVDGYTSRILDVLHQEGVQATFFLLGHQSEVHPDLVERIVAEGHEIANHSYSHPRFEQIALAAALEEVDQTQAVLEKFAPRPQFFRPPRGKVCLASTAAAWRRGLRLVFWSVDLKDFLAADTSEVLARLSRCRITAGDIVLYHGNSEASLEALPSVLAAIRSGGLSCVPVSRL